MLNYSNIAYISCLESNLTQHFHINSDVFKKDYLHIHNYKNLINNFSKSFLLKTISFQSFSHIHREHWSCAKKKKKPVSMTRVVGKGFCDVILHTCGTFAHTHARSFLLLLTPSPLFLGYL